MQGVVPTCQRNMPPCRSSPYQAHTPSCHVLCPCAHYVLTPFFGHRDKEVCFSSCGMQGQKIQPGTKQQNPQRRHLRSEWSKRAKQHAHAMHYVFETYNWFHSRGALHTSWESRTQTKLEGGGSRRYRQMHVAIVISRYPCMEEAVGPLSSESRSPSPMAPSPRTWRCQSMSVFQTTRQRSAGKEKSRAVCACATRPPRRAHRAHPRRARADPKRQHHTHTTPQRSSDVGGGWSSRSPATFGFKQYRNHQQHRPPSPEGNPRNKAAERKRRMDDLEILILMRAREALEPGPEAHT